MISNVKIGGPPTRKKNSGRGREDLGAKSNPFPLYLVEGNKSIRGDTRSGIELNGLGLQVEDERGNELVDLKGIVIGVGEC